MKQVLMGALAMACGVAALFFLRFWRQTRDRLFALFALAFAVLGINRVGLALGGDRDVRTDHLYWVRLLAFVVILAAILDKNRSSGPPPVAEALGSPHPDQTRPGGET